AVPADVAIAGERPAHRRGREADVGLAVPDAAILVRRRRGEDPAIAQRLLILDLDPGGLAHRERGRLALLPLLDPGHPLRLRDQERIRVGRPGPVAVGAARARAGPALG